MKNKRILLIALGISLSALGIAGCSSASQEATISVTDATYTKDATALFNTASSYTLKEKLVAILPHYDVFDQDGKQIATIEGTVFNSYAINLDLYDVNNNLLVSGKEEYRFTSFTHHMVLSSSDGNVQGYFEETTSDLFSLGRNMHFLDKDKIEEGTSDQPFIPVLKSGNYYDKDNRLLYTINTDIALTTDSTITVLNDSVISREKAILMRAFISEIASRQVSTSNKGSNSKGGR